MYACTMQGALYTTAGHSEATEHGGTHLWHEDKRFKRDEMLNSDADINEIKLYITLHAVLYHM